MNKLRFACNVVMIAAAVSLTGCAGKFTGGGWIPSACDPNAKATFGFNLHADDTDGDQEADTFKGQFELVDRACGVQFHGDVDTVQIVEAGVVTLADPGFALFSGTWTSASTGQGGAFNGQVIDGGQEGAAGDGDFLAITFRDGQGQVVYTNHGTIQGGNVQYHAANDK